MTGKKAKGSKKKQSISHCKLCHCIESKLSFCSSTEKKVRELLFYIFKKATAASFPIFHCKSLTSHCTKKNSIKIFFL